MLRQDLKIKAHYLAYRWFRTNNLEASHPEGWTFAEENWHAFIEEAREELFGDQVPLLVEMDLRLAE